MSLAKTASRKTPTGLLYILGRITGTQAQVRQSHFYHTHCFEELVDFAQATYLDRIYPVTRATASIRELRGTSIVDGNYLLDGGAERLILEWKVSMGQLLDRRDGVLIEPLDPDINDLLHISGSVSYQPKAIERMSHHEFWRLSTSLAPIESDGPDDKEEWNLFEKYLAITLDDLEELKERHSLSDMLGEWHLDQLLARTDELSEEDKERKAKLGGEGY